MASIDILIPAAIGLLLMLRPSTFTRPGASEEEQAKKLSLLRRIGAVLVGVALLYTAIRLSSPR